MHCAFMGYEVGIEARISASVSLRENAQAASYVLSYFRMHNRNKLNTLKIVSTMNTITGNANKLCFLNEITEKAKMAISAADSE